jgi:hypothetical protein
MRSALPVSEYQRFLATKLHLSDRFGFRPRSLPTWLFDFQTALVEWALEKGRAAIFADCGLGKTPIQLVWAQQVMERENQSVLILAPLATSAQTVREAEKFSIPARRCSDGHGRDTAEILVTNYERLHLFDPTRFIGVVCDESSILKNFDGATKAAVTEFLRRVPYRLLCTATAAPNDYIELGTSAEALGEMGYTDMLGAFFTNDEGSIEPMSYATKWRFKGHAEEPFWRWLCSWARAIRKPSDLGYEDGPFILPPLDTTVQVVSASRPFDGYLFIVPAQTLDDQRAERRSTIRERCEAVAAHAAHADVFVAWCHLNAEADLLESLIPDARQVSGSQSDDEKEELFEAFQSGQLRHLVTKPRIASFGLNWQHCAQMSVFPSHSYEQYYQSVRRCWRYGQTRPVTVHVITTAGEADVLGNLRRKADAADKMFSAITLHMANELRRARPTTDTSDRPTLPEWLQRSDCAPDDHEHVRAL